MKKMILLVALFAISSVAFAQSAVVTACEWFVGADPGVGNGNVISIGTPEGQEALAFAVATGSFTAGNLVRVNIRCKADSLRSGMLNIWGAATDAYVVLSPATGLARLVTAMSYQIDNGSFTDVDVPDAAITNLADVVSTTGLADGLHRLRVRATDDLNRTGVVIDGFFVVSNTAGYTNRLIAQMEYRIDGGAFTPVDVADGGIVNLSEIVATTGLNDGLHRLQVRSTDDLGRVGQVHDGYLVISNTAGFGPRLVTQMEYRFDGGAFTPVDVADAGIVNLAEILSTNLLAIGLHTFEVRSLDDLGRIGPVHRAYLIVSSPFVNGQVRTLSAAEFYINVDPGEGNGVAIPLPQDGAFDEGQEDAATVLTGLPVGLHLVGMRVRDDLGRWSKPVTDSLTVGPILVVQAAGNDIVLNWNWSDPVDKFYIYRANTASSAFAKIDSTTINTYTDPGILTTNLSQFYRVTFSTTALSSFRMPEIAPAAVKD